MEVGCQCKVSFIPMSGVILYETNLGESGVVVLTDV